MLGLVIECLTGEPYRDHLARRLFAPAGMTSTGLWALDEHVDRRAAGYTQRGKAGTLPARVPATDRLPGRPSSAGGVFTTAGDLMRFWEALVAGKLLSARWTRWC